MGAYVQFTKRTDFPKLAYIINLLNRHGIPCRINGRSFHAPILEVGEQFEEDAWELLTAPAKNYGIRTTPGATLDEVRDDHPAFQRFFAALPADEEVNEEAEWYAELNRGYAQDRM